MLTSTPSSGKLLSSCVPPARVAYCSRDSNEADSSHSCGPPHLEAPGTPACPWATRGAWLFPPAANPENRRRRAPTSPPCAQPLGLVRPGRELHWLGRARGAAFVAGGRAGGAWPRRCRPPPGGAAPPLPPGRRVGHCHTTFQLRTPRCSPPPPPIGSLSSD